MVSYKFTFNQPASTLPVRPRSQSRQSPGWLFSSLRESPSTTSSPVSAAVTPSSPQPLPVFQFGSGIENGSPEAPERDVFTFRFLHNVTPRPSVEPEEVQLPSPPSLPAELDAAALPRDEERDKEDAPSSFSSRLESVPSFDYYSLQPESSLLTPPRPSQRSREVSELSAYSELSDNVTTPTTPHDVRDEEAPIAPFFTAVFQNAIQQGLEISRSVVAAIEKFTQFPEPESGLGKLLKDARSLTTFHSSDTRTIAILGDSGEGKSSLINSLLHYPGIAKTSDLGSACTSVVTEYRQQKDGQTAPIVIEVEYLSQSQIEEEVRELVWNYRQLYHPSINSDKTTAEEYLSIQRESDKAWSALLAAFGNHTELNNNNKEFLSDQSDGALERVTSTLVEWTKDIVWPQGGHDGMWTSTADSAEECCDKTNAFMQDRLWPFTKIIRVYLNSVVLKTGVVLADLPGLQDTNMARVQATQTYLLKSDYVLIVAKITRAQTDKSLKDSINTVISRHVSLEDNNNSLRNFHLAVVCTKTEEIDEDAARREFCGPGKTIEQHEIEQLDRDIEQARESGSRILKKKLKLRRKQLLIDARSQHVTKGLQRAYQQKLGGATLDVFCISNKTYKKFADRGDTAMVRASGIPELRRFCHSAVAGARLLEAKNVLQAKIPSLLNSIELWAMPGPVSTDGADSSNNQLDYQVLEDAKAKTIRKINNSRKFILESFEQCILDFLVRRGDFWETAAREQGLEWFSWHWTQYNAWCLKNGIHWTSNRGSVNWNAKLNWKMRTELEFQWELFEDEIIETFESLFTFIKQDLKDLERYLDEFDPLLAGAVGFRSCDVQYKCSRIQRNMQRGIQFIRSQASEGNETSYMVKEMIPSYRRASQTRGKGKAELQRKIVQGKISGGTLFECILHQISSDVRYTTKEAFEELLAVFSQCFGRIKDDFDNFSSTGTSEERAHEESGRAADDELFKAELAHEVKRLKVKHEQVLGNISSY